MGNLNTPQWVAARLTLHSSMMTVSARSRFVRGKEGSSKKRRICRNYVVWRLPSLSLQTTRPASLRRRTWIASFLATRTCKMGAVLTTTLRLPDCGDNWKLSDESWRPSRESCLSRDKKWSNCSKQIPQKCSQNLVQEVLLR